MIAFRSCEKYGVYDLRDLVSLLRSPDGCPWDREQTHSSIRRNLIEEAYEAAEAIDSGDTAHLLEELGDVLTQVVFHADIESDNGSFGLDDVADAVVRKLLYRHPHVFGDVSAGSPEEVIKNWDELKRREKSHETVTDSLRAVAVSLPALWRAEKVTGKAAKAGFCENDLQSALRKTRDALAVMESGSVSEESIGDMLLAVTAAALSAGIDPEDALNRAVDTFIDDVETKEQSESGF